MNAGLVEEIANAVLYEGYILYPYRPSALKNQHRFNFGVVVPGDDRPGRASGDASALQAECLVRAGSSATVRVRVRFLQLVERRVGQLVSQGGAAETDRPIRYAPVDVLLVDGKAVRGWQEAIEREVGTEVVLGSLAGQPVTQDACWAADESVEPLAALDGRAVGAIVRRRETVRAELRLAVATAGSDLYKITLRIANVTPPDDGAQPDRAATLLRALVSTHAILQVIGGEFLSLTDPPADAEAAAASCHQTGLWPVLVGADPERDALLASPIILYDYPQIAPESAGDFCDGTEIDEMLALRIMTMTADEKREMREGDERGRRMLERTEGLSDEHLMRLHGVLRGLRPVDDGGLR